MIIKRLHEQLRDTARVGRRGQPFTIYKLRTMIHNAESLTGPRWAVPGDPVTLQSGSLTVVVNATPFTNVIEVNVWVKAGSTLFAPASVKPASPGADVETKPG